MASYALDVTLNVKKLTGHHSCQKIAAQHRAARSYRTGKRAQRTVRAEETPHFHLFCIAELLRCSLFWQLLVLAFYRGSSSPCVTKCQQKPETMRETDAT